MSIEFAGKSSELQSQAMDDFELIAAQFGVVIAHNREDGIVEVGLIQARDNRQGKDRLEFLHTLATSTLAGFNDQFPQQLRTGVLPFLEGQTPEATLHSLAGNTSAAADQQRQDAWGEGNFEAALNSSIGVSTQTTDSIRTAAERIAVEKIDSNVAVSLLRSLTGQEDTATDEMRAQMLTLMSPLSAKAAALHGGLKANITFPPAQSTQDLIMKDMRAALKGEDGDEANGPPPVLDQISQSDIDACVAADLEPSKILAAFIASLAGRRGRTPIDTMRTGVAEQVGRPRRDGLLLNVAGMRAQFMGELTELISLLYSQYDPRLQTRIQATCILKGLIGNDGMMGLSSMNPESAFRRLTEMEPALQDIDIKLDAIATSLIGVPPNNDCGIREHLRQLSGALDTRGAVGLSNRVFTTLMQSLALCDDDESWELRDAAIGHSKKLTADFGTNAISANSVVSRGLALSLGGLTSERAHQLRQQLITRSTQEEPSPELAHLEPVHWKNLLASINTPEIAAVRALHHDSI